MTDMLYTVAHSIIPPLARAVWRPKVEGLHHVPSSGPVIVASNHLSFFDSVVIPVVVPRKVVFLAKSDYFTGTGVKGTLVRAWFEGLGMLPVDRDDTRAAIASLDTALPWRRAMQGHAVSNVIPVVGANRTGFEPWENYPGGGQRFYGSSFIADHRGDLVSELGRDDEGVVTARFDLEFLDAHRAAWGFFRDRRVDLYGSLTGVRPA